MTLLNYISHMIGRILIESQNSPGIKVVNSYYPIPSTVWMALILEFIVNWMWIFGERKLLKLIDNKECQILADDAPKVFNKRRTKF